MSKSTDKTEIDKACETAEWEQNLMNTTNEPFFALYKDKSRYLVLMGGAGSGKSIFAGRKILERIVSEKKHRILVVRKVARTLRESCFSQLCGQISEFYDVRRFKINKTDMSITCRNGSTVLFAGLDDADKLKSIYNITGIWIEEASEISLSDFNQLDIRLRGKTDFYKQIIITFNPVNINHWLKKRFFDTTDKNATVHKSTYRDNRFLDKEAKDVLEGYKKTDPYYYSVYCLGEWGVYGKSVFAAEAVAKRISELAEPFARGDFEYLYDGSVISGVRFDEKNDGCIRIYEPPSADTPYVIGADTAGEGSDFFAAQVINNLTGEQAAVLHTRCDEDVFARQLYCLGMYYNEALVGIEANFSSYPVKELERLGYTNQYVREVFDTFGGGMRRSFGFKTTFVTRPVILALLIRFVRDETYLINDKPTLEEMLTFTRNDRGRAQAESGCHDDLVMSLAIAQHIRAQQSSSLPPAPSKKLYNFSFEKPSPDPLGRGEPIEMI